MELDDEICYCFHVTKRKILQFLRIRKPRRASQLADCGGAGTGCGWCRSWLRRYFDDSRAGLELREAVASGEYGRQRAAYIRAGKGAPPPGATTLCEENAPQDESSSSG